MPSMFAVTLTVISPSAVSSLTRNNRDMAGLTNLEKPFKIPQCSHTFKKPSHTAYTETSATDSVTAFPAPSKRAGRKASGDLTATATAESINIAKNKIFKEKPPRSLNFMRKSGRICPKKILLCGVNAI